MTEQACATDSTAGITTTAAARSATARVALSLPTTVSQEAVGVTITAGTTPHQTATEALATGRAARAPQLPIRDRSATAAGVEPALDATYRQASGRPYLTAPSRPAHTHPTEALRPAAHIVRQPEATARHQGAVHRERKVAAEVLEGAGDGFFP